MAALVFSKACWILFVYWNFACFISLILGSQEAAIEYGYGYPSRSNNGWNSPGKTPAHSSGSYYHYHPYPLSGGIGIHNAPSSQYYQKSSYLDTNLIWILLPLLIFFALKLILFALTPIFLIPIGIALLALLMPLIMMAVGSMMMMMMMMSPSSMMMMKRAGGDFGIGTTNNSIVEYFNTIKETMASNRIPDLLTRSINWEQCPERVSCEIGNAFISNVNNTKMSGSLSTFPINALVANLVIENIEPEQQENVKRTLRKLEDGISRGFNAVIQNKSNNCNNYTCQLNLVNIFDVISNKTLTPF